MLLYCTDGAFVREEHIRNRPIEKFLHQLIMQLPYFRAPWNIFDGRRRNWDGYRQHKELLEANWSKHREETVHQKKRKYTLINFQISAGFENVCSSFKNSREKNSQSVQYYYAVRVQRSFGGLRSGVCLRPGRVLLQLDQVRRVLLLLIIHLRVGLL